MSTADCPVSRRLSRKALSRGDRVGCRKRDGRESLWRTSSSSKRRATASQSARDMTLIEVGFINELVGRLTTLEHLDEHQGGISRVTEEYIAHEQGAEPHSLVER